MNTTAEEVAKLGLEGLMDRANIAFTSGYRFKGSIRAELLYSSIQAIVSGIVKFDYHLHFVTQDDFSWQKSEQGGNPFSVIHTPDIDTAFTTLCSNSYSLLNESRSPMVFVLLQEESPTAPSDFMIAQLCNHTYVDARSAEVVFNKIIAHYNALCRQDKSSAAAIEDSAKKLRTVQPDTVIQQRFEANPEASHERNVENILSYPIEDVGGHGIPMTQLNDLLSKYKQTTRAPLIQYFDVDKMVQVCREKHPDVSRNSIVCAALVKAIYNINVQEKGIAAEHIISFKMLSDILTPEMRQSYSGNYIAFVPVTANGEGSIEEIAKEIHDRITSFKASNLDVSAFALTEDAVSAALVGTADEPLSFVVTNWSNFTYTHSEDYLVNCQSIRHQSGVNIEPKDSLGAALVNRPVLVINFSPSGELCLSQFPSLRSAEESQNIGKHINSVFSGFEA